MGDIFAGGVDFLTSLFSGGGGAALADAAAPALETGVATIGPSAANAFGAVGGGLADIVGTGAGLAGGSTGLAGTLLSGGAAGGIDAALGAGVAGGAAGVADTFLNAPTTLSGVGVDSGIGAGAGADATLPAGATATSGTGLGVSGSPFPASSAAPGTATIGSPTTAGVPGLTGGTGLTGSVAPAAPGAAVAPTGAGATDLTSIAGGSAPTGGDTLTAGAASQPGSTSGNFFSNLLGKAGNQITNNPLSLVGPAAGIGGLIYNTTQANKQLPEQTALTNAATTATNNGNQLSSYLLNGTLPAGLQTAVSKATADAKTAAISNAARNGQSTDPSQNTALAGELASIDQQAAITTANVGQQLLTSGLSETQLASQDYTTLLSADQTEQNLISQSIASFAKSLGSLGTSGLKLNIGNNTVST